MSMGMGASRGILLLSFSSSLKAKSNYSNLTRTSAFWYLFNTLELSKLSQVSKCFKASLILTFYIGSLCCWRKSFPGSCKEWDIWCWWKSLFGSVQPPWHSFPVCNRDFQGPTRRNRSGCPESKQFRNTSSPWWNRRCKRTRVRKG